MKRIAGLFLIALFAGATTLGAYLLFFEKPHFAVVENQKETPFITTASSSALPSDIEELDFTIAAEKTVNAVVHVKNVTMSGNSGSIWDYIYGSGRSNPAQIGTGSGVIISSDGYIVTNNHVIDKANELKVTLNNNRTYNAEVVGADAMSDIALIKIDAEEDLPYLAFGDSDNTRIGEWVLAVGNPFNLTSTVTAGIVSAKARDLGRNQSFLQTDAAVNPGNSGGALVNVNGDLIGINTAITSQTGSYVGYSFAVPSNIARKIVEDIMEYGNVQKGILGIQTININTPLAAERGINEIEGVYIESIEEGSGAEAAKLRKGDIIKRIDDIRIRRFADLTGYVSSKRPGDQVEVTVSRDGRRVTVPVVLTKRERAQLPVIGLEVKNLSETDRKIFKTQEGVKITAVPQMYRDYNLLGKVIIAVNDEEIEDIEDARSAFQKLRDYRRFSITTIDDAGDRERLIFQ